MTKRLFPILARVMVLLAACAPQTTPTFTPADTPTETIVPATLPATATPAPPLSPTPAPTPTVARPDLAVIQPENISAVHQEYLVGDGRLIQVAISPGGGLIAYASTIGVRFLDRQSLLERGFLPSSTPVSTIDFSPDGSLLAVGFDNGRVRLFRVAELLTGNNLAEPKPLEEIKAHTFRVTRVRFSPDGSLLATASWDRTANIWKVADGTRVRSLGGFILALTEVVFSPDGRYISAGSLDGTLRVWEVRSGKVLAQWGVTDKKRLDQGLYPVSLLWDPSDQYLQIGWANGQIQSWRWQKKDEKPQPVASHPGQLQTLIQVSASKLVSLGEDGTTVAWLVGQTGGVYTLQEKDHRLFGDQVKSLAISSDGETWVVGKFPCAIEKWVSTQGGASLAYHRPGAGIRVTSVVLPDQEHLMITGSGDGVLRLWDIDHPVQPLEVTLADGEAIEQLVLSADQRWLAAAVGDTVKIYALTDLLALAANPAGGSTVQQPTLSLSTGGTAHRIALSPDGTLLAASTLLANTIQLWSLPEGKHLIDLTRFDHPVEALSFSPTENSLAAGATDHRVFLWRNLSVKELSSLESDETLEPFYIQGGFVVTSLIWSPVGDQLAISGTYKQARVVNPKDGQVRYYLNNATDQLVTAAFSPDRNLIASAGVDGIIRLYSARDGKLLATWSGHAGLVNAIQFSPRGDRLVSCGEDGTIRIWSIPADSHPSRTL